MAGINLLPWRQERRRQQQRNFAMMVGACLLLTVFIMLLVRLEISQRTPIIKRGGISF